MEKGRRKAVVFYCSMVTPFTFPEVVWLGVGSKISYTASPLRQGNVGFGSVGGPPQAPPEAARHRRRTFWPFWSRVNASASVHTCGKAVVVRLQAGALGTAPQRGAACGAAGGAARSWAGSVPERRARGGEGPGARAGSAQLADRTTQDKRNARGRWETTKHTKQGGHPKQHGRQRRAGGGARAPHGV